MMKLAQNSANSTKPMMDCHVLQKGSVQPPPNLKTNDVKVFFFKEEANKKFPSKLIKSSYLSFRRTKPLKENVEIGKK